MIPRTVHGASADVRRDAISAASWSAVILWIALAPSTGMTWISSALRYRSSVRSARSPAATRASKVVRNSDATSPNVIFDGRAISPRRSLAKNASRSERASVRVRAWRVFILQAPFASAYPTSYRRSPRFSPFLARTLVEIVGDPYAPARTTLVVHQDLPPGAAPP